MSEAAEVAVDPVRTAIGASATEIVDTADCLTAVVDRDNLVDLLDRLRDDPELKFVRLVDICGVDYLDLDRSPRFAVVYHVHSIALNRYIRIRVPVDEDDLIVPSLTELWPGANWFERETYDLYGIRFAGHPDLKRILLPDEWEGYPLRKDYAPPPEPIEFSFNPELWQKAVQRGD